MPYLFRLIAALLAFALAGCAGTIQRESNAGAMRIGGATYANVNVVLTDDARRMQADNPQFNVRELSDYIRRRLESGELLRTDGTHTVEVTIDSFRVRSAVAAVLLGIMAGTDNIQGHVRVLDRNGRAVHSFKIDASYGLGGWGGGQDGMRMNWLYDKFSELTVAELAGKTEVTSLAKGPASASAPAPARPASAMAVRIAPAGGATAPATTVTASPGTFGASGYAAIDDIDAVPYLSDRGRNGYREYLGKPTPKAFAIAANGYWFSAWTLVPADASMPTDPTERAVVGCEKAAQMPCKLYAVNRAVVWRATPR